MRAAIVVSLLCLASTYEPLRAEAMVLNDVEGTFDASVSIEALRGAYCRLEADLDIRVLPANVVLSYSNSGMVAGDAQPQGYHLPGTGCPGDPVPLPLSTRIAGRYHTSHLRACLRKSAQ